MSRETTRKIRIMSQLWANDPFGVIRKENQREPDVAFQAHVVFSWFT